MSRKVRQLLDEVLNDPVYIHIKPKLIQEIKKSIIYFPEIPFDEIRHIDNVMSISLSSRLSFDTTPFDQAIEAIRQIYPHIRVYIVKAWGGEIVTRYGMHITLIGESDFMGIISTFFESLQQYFPNFANKALAELEIAERLGTWPAVKLNPQEWENKFKWKRNWIPLIYPLPPWPATAQERLSPQFLEMLARSMFISRFNSMEMNPRNPQYHESYSGREIGPYGLPKGRVGEIFKGIPKMTFQGYTAYEYWSERYREHKQDAFPISAIYNYMVMIRFMTDENVTEAKYYPPDIEPGVSVEAEVPVEPEVPLIPRHIKALGLAGLGGLGLLILLPAIRGR